MTTIWRSFQKGLQSMAPSRMVQLSKLRIQKELKLQAEMIKSLQTQGFFATKTSDRFKAGRPDLRIGHRDIGQLDVELKYSLESFDEEGKEYDTGMTKLQWLKIKEMNEHGMPAVCLVYSEVLDLFFVTTLLRDTLPPVDRCVTKLPSKQVLDGGQLMTTALGHLHDIGY